ncbi:uncharacterized protein Dana_GF17685 [Drosophila ananassae]|uniref:Arrestin C-terminal-like domain-containing protein n=1 Tax=Drosophila ananassae TaxID=7217 RepID=B3LYZ1_DROAN|nr:arrestin domain-containing protein 3 [Drosophila ananassae]EDV41865.2 uncharacterized protein Dana_GF17685 [Drosophila ananassae]
MTSTCSFEFDRPEEVYYSGEIVRGRALLNISSNRSVRGVYIILEGEAKVQWNDDKNSQDFHHGFYFKGNQSYLNHKIRVFGSGDLTTGIHTYEFSIPLPLECPSSLVMEYGKISYVISLLIDRDDPYNNLFQYPLTILQNYNLNLSPELMTPLVHEDVKHLCCWFCRSAPVFYTFIIPYGGYAPGQKIQYIMKINNQSTYDVDGFEVNLRQNINFRAQVPQTKERKLEKTLSHSLQRMSVRRLSKKSFTGLLDIPSVPPSSRYEGIILVQYFVSVIISMGECHMDSEFEVPIVIGTSPFPQSEEDTSISQLFDTENFGTPHSVSSDQPPSYDTCKPPNYEEASRFRPRYPMFLPTAPPPQPEDEISALFQTDTDRRQDIEAPKDEAKPYGWSLSS